MPIGKRIAYSARTPTLISLMKWSKLPHSDFFSQFKSAKLREGFEVLFTDYVKEGYSPGAIFMILGLMARRSAGYPIGGSRAFAQAIESKYLKLGGKLHFAFKVDEKVIAALGGFIPGFKGSVEAVAVATPSTFIRYTDNWHGSCLGWAYVHGMSPRKTIDGLDNFYTAGQWVNPGGGVSPAESTAGIWPRCCASGRACASSRIRLVKRELCVSLFVEIPHRDVINSRQRKRVLFKLIADVNVVLQKTAKPFH